MDGVPYFLAITDTAGQEEYRGLWAASNLKSDAFLLVYDITNASTLSALDYFMEMIDIEAEQRVEDNQRLLKELGDSAQGLDVGMPPPVKIIAGNKCDLKEGRVVGAKEGLEYARKHGCGFMETSAREMVNIEETFARIHHPFPFFFLDSNTLIVLVRRVVEARKQHYQKEIQATNIPPTAGSSPTKRSAATGQNKGAALKSSNEEGSHLRSFCCGIFSGKERPSQGQQRKIGKKGSVLGHEASSKSAAPRLWRRLSCW